MVKVEWQLLYILSDVFIAIIKFWLGTVLYYLCKVYFILFCSQYGDLINEGKNLKCVSKIFVEIKYAILLYHEFFFLINFCW